MAVLVSLDRASKAQGTTTILDQVSLGLGDGDRIGIVGRNGAGKTTLIDVLTLRQDVDSGRVTQATGLRTGVLAQMDDLDPAVSVLEAVVGADTPEHLWRGDAHTRAVLEGLGVETLLERQVGSLSGGERRRAALAKLLVTDLDLLMLDEPTNHLDVEGVAWLAAHLTGTPRHKALVTVTHDRWFLDEVASMTWEVAAGQVHAYEGGYSAYVLARAERQRQAATEEAKRKNLVRKELAWLRRGAPARTSKPRYRIEAANELIADEPPPRDSAALQHFSATRLGKSVYDVEDALLSFGGRALLRDVTWRLGPGDRVGLIGVNGAGKTTLLRVLTGAQSLDAGQVRIGVTVQAGYLSQDAGELPDDLRVLEAVEEIARVLRVGREELTASQLLERFGFPAAKQWTPVADLSGGERRRLQLLRLLMGGPNVLVLDEPTNDLDVDTLIALEDLLDSWAGTLVVVSHDRWFLERVTDSTVALLGDGQLAALPGGVDEYLARSRRAAPSAAAASRRPAGDSRAERKELQRMERALERLDRKEKKLHGQLAEAASNYDRAVELDAELRAVVAEKGEYEHAWLVLSEQLTG
ncbi:MAG TPA: ABC-F family ATP-binding cassette domain-containing protein [Mycobacteriales bacterium]|jgi:ATP-binding cassette subfamily F protein uup|nr:ABC-F family ATP-binding cassette domain-containing protein [Mycobacteriales bacterium]